MRWHRPEKLQDEELVSYILTELNLEYNPVISTIAARVEPITVGELYTQLVSFEQRMEMHGGGSQSSANMVAKGGHDGATNKLLWPWHHQLPWPLLVPSASFVGRRDT